MTAWEINFPMIIFALFVGYQLAEKRYVRAKFKPECKELPVEASTPQEMQ